jgi:hypothetical protein
VNDGRENRVDDGQPGDLVRQRGRQEVHTESHGVDQRWQPGGGLDDVVERRSVRIDVVGAEPGGLAVHQARVRGPDVLVGESQPSERTRSEIGDHDVAHLDQPQHRRPSGFGLEVERDRSLVRVQIERDAGQLRMVAASADQSARITRCILELDDVGPHAGEQLAGVGTHEDSCELQYPKADERPRPVSSGSGGVAAVHSRPFWVHVCPLSVRVVRRRRQSRARSDADGTIGAAVFQSGMPSSGRPAGHWSSC